MYPLVSDELASQDRLLERVARRLGGAPVQVHLTPLPVDLGARFVGQNRVSVQAPYDLSDQARTLSAASGVAEQRAACCAVGAATARCSLPRLGR